MLERPAHPRQGPGRKWWPLDVLVFNTHAGHAITSGGLEWLLDQVHPEIVLLQEVQRRASKRAARRELPAIDWARIGPPMFSMSGTVIFARRDRLGVQERVDSLLSRKRRNDRRPGLWTVRRLNGAELLDRRTHRYVRASSIHTWTIGPMSLAGNHPVVRAHRHQVESYARWHSLSDPGDVDICGGDLNERLDGHNITRAEWPFTAKRTFRDVAGMKPAFQITRHGERRVRLDDVFVRPTGFLRVVDRDVIDLPSRFKADHPAIHVRLRIKERTR